LIYKTGIHCERIDLRKFNWFHWKNQSIAFKRNKTRSRIYYTYILYIIMFLILIIHSRYRISFDKCYSVNQYTSRNNYIRRKESCGASEESDTVNKTHLFSHMHTHTYIMQVHKRCRARLIILIWSLILRVMRDKRVVSFPVPRIPKFNNRNLYRTNNEFRREGRDLSHDVIH